MPVRMILTEGTVADCTQAFQISTCWLKATTPMPLSSMEPVIPGRSTVLRLLGLRRGPPFLAARFELWSSGPNYIGQGYGDFCPAVCASQALLQNPAHNLPCLALLHQLADFFINPRNW